MPVFSDVSLSLRAGECLLIRGPSGSGKSSLLGALAGLYPAWGGELEGEVLLDGTRVSDLDPATRLSAIGVLQQESASQFTAGRVVDELAFAPANLGWPKDRIESGVRAALERFGLSPLALRSPHTLSGGEQSLVLLAGLSILCPRVLLLDEPLAALDPENARRMVLALAAIKASGSALVIVEHRQEDLAEIVDRELLLGGEGPLAPARLEDGYWPAIRECVPLVPADTSRGEALLCLESVSVSPGGHPLLSAVSLSLHAGEARCLMGPNGAGKTSLLSIAARLCAPERGTVRLCGSVRMVSQEPLEHFCAASLREEARIDLRGRKVSALEKDRRTQAVLASLGLTAAIERSPFLLSEGEKRRLALASALLGAPAILLLDEPTAALDPASRALVVAALREYRLRGGAILCVTHDPALPAALGAEVIRVPGSWRARAVERPVAASKLVAAPSCPGCDPRVPFLWLIASLVLALKPLALPVSLGLLGLVVLSSFVGKRDRSRPWCSALTSNPVWAFLRSLVLASLVPGVLLALLVSPLAAAEAFTRLSLVSLLVWRWAHLVDTRPLPAALSAWGFPYSAGFALQASSARLDAFSRRAARIHGLLRLRLSRPNARGRRGEWKPCPRFSAAIARHLFVPVVVLMWREAERLAMNLDLRGFTPRCPESLRPPRMPLRDRVLLLAALAAVLIVLVL